MNRGKGGRGNNQPLSNANDIKSSLENQRLINKQKFEDPYFIKVGDEKTDNGMKIVRGGLDQS